ncbi:MAG: hypothetical protein JSS75_09525 [Bacteroidetes bacterium]|nr:hypothetical protein [Bacteroidota bacterium]
MDIIEHIARSRSSAKRSLVLAAAIWLFLCGCHSSGDPLQPVPSSGPKPAAPKDTLRIVPSSTVELPTDTLEFFATTTLALPRPMLFEWEFDDSFHVITGLDLDTIRYYFREPGEHVVRLKLIEPKSQLVYDTASTTIQRTPSDAERTFAILQKFSNLSVTMTAKNHYSTNTNNDTVASETTVFQPYASLNWHYHQCGVLYSFYQPPNSYPHRTDSRSTYIKFSDDGKRIDSLDIAIYQATEGQIQPADPNLKFTISQRLTLINLPLTYYSKDSVVVNLKGPEVEPKVIEYGTGLYLQSSTDFYYRNSTSTDWGSPDSPPELRLTLW